MAGRRARWMSECLRGMQGPGGLSARTSEEPMDAEEGSGAPEFRLLFCNNAYFPTAASLSRESLKPYPHILVEELPDEEIWSKIHEYDMCVCRTVELDSETLSRAKKLKVITQFGMGLDKVDIEAATRMGIKVGRIPSRSSYNALSCAEQAIYLMLSLLRDQKGMAQSLLDRRLGFPMGQTLFKKTVLIVGFGNIGKELALRLKAFGVRILAVRPSWAKKYSQEGPGEDDASSTLVEDAYCLISEKGGLESLPAFNSQADIVVMCCPLTTESKGMVNESFLAGMKRGALLVNVARGGLLDYNAVSKALNSGQLGGLGTDVTWCEPIDPNDPILQHPNVLVTPHVAGVTELAYRTMGEVIAASALQLYEGKPITGLEFVN